MKLLTKKVSRLILAAATLSLFSLCTNLLPAQTKDPGVFTNFTTENGLPLDGIYYSMIDRKGNLWLGTSGGGVIRYDGKSFTQFTVEQGLTSNYISKFIEDRHGDLWFGTAGGVSRFDGKTFTNRIVNENIASKMVYCILEDHEGNLWFGTDGGGVCRYNGRTFEHLPINPLLANSKVVTLFEDKTGNIWFGTERGGACRYDGKSFSNFSTLDGLAHGGINCITEDKAGNLWFGTDGGGSSRYDGLSFASYTTRNGLASNTVKCILEDKNGILWFGTDAGVSQFDGITFTGFSTEDGLVSNSITSMTEDRAGNLWICTEAGGISCYRGKPFTNFTTGQGLAANLVWCIGEDKPGNLWFGTLAGASLYDGKSFTSYTTRDGLSSNRVQSITPDNAGNLWLGTGKGISRFDGKSFTNYTTEHGLINNFIRCITEDAKGILWIGTNRGICRYDLKSFSHFDVSDGLCSNTVNSITEDSKGNLWLGTENGMSRFDGKTFVNFSTEQGLANNLVSCIVEDRYGNLWIGTDGGGISRYDGKSFLNFNSDDGLPDNIVAQIVIDSQGNIVVGTNDGLAVIAAFSPVEISKKTKDNISPQNDLANEELAVFNPRMHIYNTACGYPVKDVNFGQNGMFMDRSGIIWIGTGSDKTGLVRFDPEALHKDSTSPVVFIQGIKINNETIAWNISGRKDSSAGSGKAKFGDIQFDSITSFYPLPINLTLPYKNNNITFEFGAVELLRPDLVNYQYFLEGYDRDWSPVNPKTTASFGNIREGTYTFKVRAQPHNQEWSDPLSYSFRVLPPASRSWWAYLLYSLLILSGMILTVRIYNNRLINRNLVLQNIITEKERVQSELIIAKNKAEESDRLKSAFLANMSHEIRTPMNGILGFTELLKDADLTGEEQQQYIGIIEKSGDRLLKIISNIVVYSELESGAMQVKVSEININEQLDFIDSFFKPLADQKGLHLTCTKRLSDDAPAIQSDKEKIESILISLVTNAINFTKTGSIEFGCQKKDPYLEFFVKDTGIGITEEQKKYIFNRFRKSSEELTRTQQGAGLGLSIAKGYVELLGGKIWVESSQGSGSTFYFTINPLRK